RKGPGVIERPRPAPTEDHHVVAGGVVDGGVAETRGRPRLSWRLQLRPLAGAQSELESVISPIHIVGAAEKHEATARRIQDDHRPPASRWTSAGAWQQ